MNKYLIATSNDIVFYKNNNGDTNIELLINGETLWVTKKTVAEIFDIDRTVITKHLKNIWKKINNRIKPTNYKLVVFFQLVN